MKITKSVVDKLPVPEPGPQGKAQRIHRDDQLIGFGVRVTSSGVKSFIVEKLITGKVRRITLGRYPSITTEQARKEAQKLIGKIVAGHDPHASKRQTKALGVTLGQAFAAFLEARKNLKPKTVYDYRRVMDNTLLDWNTKPVVEITKDMVAKRHRKLGDNNGQAYANLSMRVLRAVMNFAAGQYEDAKGRTILPENPVKRLSQTRAWYKNNRRDSVIKAHQLPAWYLAVMSLQDGMSNKAETVRDFLLLLLFTGLRRQEAAQLQWENVDLRDRTLTITDTKNNTPHTLPLSDFLVELLSRRKQAADSAYVFPGTGVTGYLIEPKRQMEKVKQQSGVDFTIHDLRRTFITTAESLDISAYALKRLLNHKMNNDVTAGYIVSDVERLRKPMQTIASALLAYAQAEKQPRMIELHRVVAS